MFLEGKTLELMLAAIVALVVVGPKDLPILLRRFGQFMARLRGMAAEFRASFDEMARQSELDELRKEVEALRRGQISEIAAQAGQAELNEAAGEIHRNLSEVGVQLHPPMSYQYVEAPSAPLEPAAPLAAEPPAAAKAAKPRPKPKAAAGKAQAKAPIKKTTAKAASGKPAGAARRGSGAGKA